jgi:hypothetical protein
MSGPILDVLLFSFLDEINPYGYILQFSFPCDTNMLFSTAFLQASTRNAGRRRSQGETFRCKPISAKPNVYSCKVPIIMEYNVSIGIKTTKTLTFWPGKRR